MKNKRLFDSRLIVTIIIAGLMSSVLGIILTFVFGNLGIFNESIDAINAAVGVVFGLLVGYKLNDLTRESKK